MIYGNVKTGSLIRPGQPAFNPTPAQRIVGEYINGLNAYRSQWNNLKFNDQAGWLPYAKRMDYSGAYNLLRNSNPGSALLRPTVGTSPESIPSDVKSYIDEQFRSALLENQRKGFPLTPSQLDFVGI